MKKSKKQIMNEYLQDSEAYQDFCKEHNLVTSISGFKEFCKEVECI